MQEYILSWTALPGISILMMISLLAPASRPHVWRIRYVPVQLLRDVDCFKRCHLRDGSKVDTIVRLASELNSVG